MHIIAGLILSITILACQGRADEESLVEPPVAKVIEEPHYTLNLSYFDDGNIEIYSRVYKKPTDNGKIIINAIYLPNGKHLERALMQENIYQDNYVFLFNFNRSSAYHHHIDKFPNGKEAILVYRIKDGKLVALIGKKKTGAWDTHYDAELTALVRKYHPELEK